MGLLDFLKKHSGEHKETRGEITHLAPGPIPNEDYQKKRQKEELFWEKKHDLSTVEGIMAIPIPTKKNRFVRNWEYYWSNRILFNAKSRAL